MIWLYFIAKFVFAIDFVRRRVGYKGSVSWCIAMLEMINEWCKNSAVVNIVHRTCRKELNEPLMNFHTCSFAAQGSNCLVDICRNSKHIWSMQMDFLSLLRKLADKCPGWIFWRNSTKEKLRLLWFCVGSRTLHKPKRRIAYGPSI